MRIFKIFLGIFFIALLVKTKYLAVDGFLPSKIAYFGDYQRKLEVPYKNLDYILNQNFYYLGKGRQSFVFESKDNKYVIKFIRYHKYQIPISSRILEHFNLLTKKQKRILFERKDRAKRAMNSYKMVYDKFRDLSKVLYVHLNQTNDLNKQISLVNKLGIKYKIDLDKVGFIIQEKIPQVCNLELQNRDFENIIDSYLEFLVWKIQNNIATRDFVNIIRNSGYDGNRFIEFDVGSYSYFVSTEEKRLEFDKVSRELEIFLKDKNLISLDYYKKVKKEKLRCLESL